MKRMMVLGSALLLTATSLARADETERPAGAAVEAAPTAVAPAPAPADTPPLPAPPVPLAQSVAAAPTPEPVQGPEPYTGWGRGRRPPMYLNMMLFVAGLSEDGSNRLTTRDSKLLEGFGGVLRIGAVLNEHHRLGARMQSFVRPTKKVLLDPPATTTTNEDWGAVTLAYFGPEYLYDTGLGIYAAGSLGVAGLVSSSKVDDKNDDHDHVERGSAGVAGIVSVGYEWRANKWFAMNAEAFGGLYHGVDDNENSMNGAIFGLGMGMGF
jgi:hypothetical protein